MQEYSFFQLYIIWDYVCSLQNIYILHINNQKSLLLYQMSNTSSNTTHEESLVWEASVPNESWTEKTRKLYDDLMDQCKDGEWEKVISFQNFSAKERLFVRAVEEKGKMFEYAMFLNRKEERIKAVMQFGPWLQGPKG